MMSPHVLELGRSRLTAYDLGAHVATWSVDGDPVLWFSDEAVLDGRTALRGGVPLCFPWFAAGPDGRARPRHGVLRTARWRPVTPAGPDDPASARLSWELDGAELADSPGAFHVRYDVTLRETPRTSGSTSGSAASRAGDTVPELELALTVTNTGDTDRTAEVALHSYYAVSDVRSTAVHGLGGATYLDKLDEGREHRQAHGPVTFTGPTDRIYRSPGHPELVLEDGPRRVEIMPDGLPTTVLWTPWREGAAQTADIPDADWHRFLCVENAALGEGALRLPAGSTVRVGTRIRPLTAPTTEGPA